MWNQVGAVENFYCGCEGGEVGYLGIGEESNDGVLEFEKKLVKSEARW